MKQVDPVKRHPHIPQEKNRRISSEEVRKRLQAWTEVTELSLKLKGAAIRKRNPEYTEEQVSAEVREQLSRYGTNPDG